MLSYRFLILIAMVSLLLAVGCSSVPKIELKKVKPISPMVVERGYGFGEDAKEKAEDMAIKYAHAAANPRTMRFEYFSEGTNNLTKIVVENPEATIQISKPLKDGTGHSAIAKTTRSEKVVQAFRNFRFMKFTMKSDLPTLQDRVSELLQKSIDYAIRYELGILDDEDKPTPEKVFGYITFYKNFWNTENEDVTELTVTMKAKVEGTSEMTNVERAMVRLNAWRRLRSLEGFEELAEQTFESAMEVDKSNTEFLTEYASFWIEQKKKKRAIKALLRAHDIEPARVEFLRWLRQLYADMGNKAKVKEMENILMNELNVEEEDLSSNMKYRETRTWTNKDDGGLVNFQGMSAEEAEEAAERAKVKEE